MIRPMSHPVPLTLVDRAYRGAAQWTCGALFALGLLGVLRRHFAGFVDTPGAGALGFVATPFGHLVALVIGIAGMVMMATAAGQRRYAAGAGIAILLLAAIGRALAGSGADVLGHNGRMTALLSVIGLVCLATVAWARLRAARVSSD